MALGACWPQSGHGRHQDRPGGQGGLCQWGGAGESWGLAGFRIVQVRRGAEKPEGGMGPSFPTGSGV